MIVVALPVFALAGWRLDAWAIAAALWVVYLAIGLLLERLALGMDNLGSAGVVAVGRMFRAVALTGVLIAVAVSDSDLGLPAAIVYALAFTVEFGLSLHGVLCEGRRGREVEEALALALGGARARRARPRRSRPTSTRRRSSSSSRGSRSTSGRSTCRSTRAVVYILLGALLSCLIGIVFMRVEAQHVAGTARRRSAR